MLGVTDRESVGDPLGSTLDVDLPVGGAPHQLSRVAVAATKLSLAATAVVRRAARSSPLAIRQI